MLSGLVTMLKRKRRQTLTAADVADFTRIAAGNNSNVPGLVRYTWWPAPDANASAVQVECADGSSRSVAFSDIVADADGVFYFGWDEETRNAIWKWVPAHKERRDAAASSMWVTF